jgi:cystathionine beta-lyase family protein involved in aluminum resistance
MMNGTKQVAQRIVNAENRFLDTVMEIGHITHTEALRVLAAYRKAKVVKMDPVMGDFHVKHGAFMEADVIQRAAKEQIQ